jgi:hypothetical protein
MGCFSPVIGILKTCLFFNLEICNFMFNQKMIKNWKAKGKEREYKQCVYDFNVSWGK